MITLVDTIYYPITHYSRADMDDADINPGDNLFITGLSIRTTGADLEALFEKYGKVK